MRNSVLRRVSKLVASSGSLLELVSDAWIERVDMSILVESSACSDVLELLELLTVSKLVVPAVDGGVAGGCTAVSLTPSAIVVVCLVEVVDKV